jgi:ATP-dependent DNA ligase
MDSFPPLFKLNANTGKVQQWIINIEQSGNKVFIITNYGARDGKQIVHSKQIEEGKRGRSLMEQATQDATRKWINKKEKELYSEEEVNEPTSSIVVRPMLAQTYDLKKVRSTTHRGYTIPFPAMAQRKYDGIRCIAYRRNGQIILESRKGTPFVGFVDLTAELEPVFSNLSPSTYLDGELFTDRLDFEHISGLVRSKQTAAATAAATMVTASGKTKKLTEKQQKALLNDQESLIKKSWIDFHIYDMFDIAHLSRPFKERIYLLHNTIDWASLHKCLLVETVIVQNIDQLDPLHTQFVSEGFEGVILRDMDGPYQINNRSKYLQKYKEFMDDEFQIIGFHEGVGNEKGAVVWECITSSGQKFAVRPRGTFESRKELFQTADENIGKWLTVIFQEYSTDGIPRFPVGKCIRIGGI